MIFSLPVQRTGREKPVDYVGLLKVQTPADLGLDSDSAQLSDMIHNPTLQRTTVYPFVICACDLFKNPIWQSHKSLAKRFLSRNFGTKTANTIGA